MKYSFAVAFSCVALLVAPVICVEKCYECEYFDYLSNNETSGNLEACEESPPPKKFLKACSETVPENGQPTNWQCVKSSGRIEIDDENYNYIRRQCMPGKILEATCKDTKSLETQYGFIKRGKQCVCDDKDGCNAGSTVGFGVLTLSAGLITVIMSSIWRSA